MAENRQRGKSEGGILTSVQGLQITKVLDEKKNPIPILFHFEGFFRRRLVLYKRRELGCKEIDYLAR